MPPPAGSLQRYASGRLRVAAQSAQGPGQVDPGEGAAGVPCEHPEARSIWWNFVSTSSDRIEQAKQDWSNGRFAGVPGETEFISLPD